MSIRVLDKDGKPRHVNALRVLSDPKGFRDRIEGLKKRGARSNSSPKSRDEKLEAKTTSASKENRKPEESTEDLHKKREEMLAQLQNLTADIAKINEHTKNEVKQSRTTSKDDSDTAAGHTKSDSLALPDTDPRWPGSRATKTDFKDMGVVEAERAELTLDQCVLLLYLNEHYDKIKYETIAARFFDKTSVRVTATEVKLMVEQESLKKRSE